jgi:hypothetical protein
MTLTPPKRTAGCGGLGSRMGKSGSGSGSKRDHANRSSADKRKVGSSQHSTMLKLMAFDLAFLALGTSRRRTPVYRSVRTGT